MKPTKATALPVGFKFRPSDIEISTYFLKKKALGQTMTTRTVPEECHDVFSRHPRDLPGDPGDDHRYFYYRRRVRDQDTRNIWTPMGEESNVLHPTNDDAEVVGIKRQFTLAEQGEEPDNDIYMWDEEPPPKYNWFLDEIRLPSTIVETDWVFCHIYREKIIPECVVEYESDLECEEEEEDRGVLPPSPP